MINKTNLNKYFSVTLCAFLLMGVTASCTYGAESSTVTTTAESLGYLVNVKFDEDDYYFDWKSEKYETINLGEGSAEITKSGIYEVSGNLKNGSLQVNVDKTKDTGTVFIVLNNAALNSDTTSPINILEAKKAVLILEGDTANTVTQGDNITVDQSGNPSGAIFSKADLTIAGTGTLDVTTEFNDGISSKDDLKITGGTINIKAKKDGMVGKDLLAIETSIINITAGKDGMRATNATDAAKGNVVIEDGKYDITTGNDGIQAENILQIDGGNFEINSGGGYPGVITKANDQKFEMGGMGGMKGEMPQNMEQRLKRPTDGAMMVPPDGDKQLAVTTQSATAETETETETESKKALKAVKAVVVNDGTFNLSAYDDGIHSNGDVIISGGSLTVETADDAIHSDLNLIIDKGDIKITKSYEAIEGANVTINDGSIDITSKDDGINITSSAGILTINGGEITINANGDGIDSNGDIVQNGGKIIINTATIGGGDSAVDYDGTYTEEGGSLLDQDGNAITHNPGMQGGGRGEKQGQQPPKARQEQPATIQ